jgi:quercetin dioxygenase-like cupin family protein
MPVIVGHDQLASIPEERISDKISRKVMSGKQGMMVWWRFKAGGHAAAHQHPHEQMSWMLSGRMDLRIGSEKRSMVAGDIAVIPGGVEHEAFFPEDTEVLDFFAPPREDFLAGGPPPYMKQAQGSSE